MADISENFLGPKVVPRMQKKTLSRPLHSAPSRSYLHSILFNALHATTKLHEIHESKATVSRMPLALGKHGPVPRISAQ